MISIDFGMSLEKVVVREEWFHMKEYEYEEINSKI